MLPSDDEILKSYSLEGFLQRHPFTPQPVSLSELESHCRSFEQWEPRDSMYRVSTFLVREGWGDPPRLVDALSVLLLVWNGAFYRYGTFDQQMLEDCLCRNAEKLGGFRSRDLRSFSDGDGTAAQSLFISLSEALKRTVDGVQSPVSAAKALHLLAPNFFPLWDQNIAPAYGCPYTAEFASVAYVVFARRIRLLAILISDQLADDTTPQKEWLLRKPLLKRIDEYNYMKYTVAEMERRKPRAKAKAQ